MLKDREQKEAALKFSIANRWFPQLEVDVHALDSVGAKVLLATDLDVLASIPDRFKGFTSVVFDCKTKARESAINRAFWLSGVLTHLKAERGFCILKKDRIESDHILLADKLKVVLLSEDEFSIYASTTAPDSLTLSGNVSNLDLWEKFLAISQQFPALEEGVRFIRSQYWMIEDDAEAIRKTLVGLRKLHPELDPAKSQHMALFFDFAALFAKSLATLTTRLFRLYLKPDKQSVLSDALLIMLYGGREAYEHRNEMFKMASRLKDPENIPNLSLPEWDKFLSLMRQLLDAPLAVSNVPLILREVGFSFLATSENSSLSRRLCAESPQGARFALLIMDYLVKASKLPPEFGKNADNVLIPLIPVR